VNDPDTDSDVEEQACFAWSVRHQRPFITLKAGLSADGKLAPAPGNRRPGQLHWITGSAAKADVHRLRHQSDAILTGIGTVLADDPLLTDRSGRHRRRPLLRVILDAQLRTSASSRLVLSANDDLLILCSPAARPDARAVLRGAGARVEEVSTTGGQLSLTAVLEVLTKLDVLSVLLEGGSTLNASFLRADLVDRVILYYAPSYLGDDAVPFAAGMSSPRDLETRLQRVTRVEFPRDIGADIRLSGYIHDPMVLG
jgi:diaminohydroxyphosphoribosylaminopyrimidine deaminase / 5-amino-6-(5-phosphoribosylamino)uracil reductase